MASTPETTADPVDMELDGLTAELKEELWSARVRPVFSTKRYRKIIARNPSDGKWQIQYMPKRKKTWTSQSQAGFEKACQVRAEKCKVRKQERLKKQIEAYQQQLTELEHIVADPTEDELDEFDESSGSDSPMDQEVNPTPPPAKVEEVEKKVLKKRKIKA